MTSDDKVTYFGETDARNKKVRFGIKAKDRTRHVYVIGKTGMGKSTLLENMAVQDIQSGEGICFIDPHGKTAELLLNYVPESRLKDVLYFAPFDVDHPIAFNVMEDVGYDKRHLVVSGLMSTFKKIWVDAWSARMEYILSNTLLALLEYPGATLLGVNKMFSDKAYRKKVVDNISDPAVKSFWVDEFAKYTDKFAAEATPAIQNKIGQFTNNPLIRNIIGQSKSSFDLRKMMDERKIIIVNLSKGRVGESNANLLGAMLITKIYLAAMSRADVPESVMRTLPNFYLYVDEFQSFANESFADILSEARKYKLNLTMAHQYIEQMSDEVRAAVFGNVGTMIVFRVGSYDAEVLEKEFAPQFTAEDIVNLGFTQIYLRLMIDGIGSQPFSATTMPPIPEPAVSFKEQAIESSRAQFGQLRSLVEEAVRAQTLGDRTTQEKPVPPVDKPKAPREENPIDRSLKAESAPRAPKADASSAAGAPGSRVAGGTNAGAGQATGQNARSRAPERRDRPTPPPDGEGGFQSFDSLRNMVKPRQPQPARRADPSQAQGSGMQAARPEKRGVTEESRRDLKQALAAIMGDGAKPGQSEPRQSAHPRPQAEAAPRPQQPQPQPRPEPQARPELKPQPTPKPSAGERREVPEHVLKKILEM